MCPVQLYALLNWALTNLVFNACQVVFPALSLEEDGRNIPNRRRVRRLEAPSILDM